MIQPILEIKGLRTYFYTYAGVVKALDGVELMVEEGDILGVVGETGCGKSMTAFSILRLIQPPGRIVDGEVIFEEEDLLQKSEEEMRSIRGAKIAMIFQEPTSSLNPVFTIGEQITDVIVHHQKVSRQEAQENTLALLRMVDLPDPERTSKQYPHELSGGMRQRAMIAMALSCRPRLLIADEPTTALDVTVEAQILQLIRRLKDEFSMSVFFITHDLAVVAQICNKVAVMYAGKVVEYARVEEFFSDPKHPYTLGLLEALPGKKTKGEKLQVISGIVPSGIDPPSGCRFHPRCPYAMQICYAKEPPFYSAGTSHKVACYLYGGKEDD